MLHGPGQVVVHQDELLQRPQHAAALHSFPYGASGKLRLQPALHIVACNEV